VRENTNYARALARHVKAALLHLHAAGDLAELAGTGIYASEHDVAAAGDAVEDLDMCAIGNARSRGAAPAETYAHTERWCQCEGGSLPAQSWPREPGDRRRDRRQDPQRAARLLHAVREPSGDQHQAACHDAV